MKNKILPYALLTTVLMVCCATSCEPIYSSYTGEVIDMKVVNANHEKEKPIVSDEPIKKEAYVLQINYTFKVWYKQGYYERNDDTYYLYTNNREFHIYCNSDLDAQYPAGSDVTELFVEIPERRENTKENVLTENYVLRHIPQAGEHAFTVYIETEEGKKIEAKTNLVTLY